MGMLHTLELENFKSYKGKQVIGPFSRFTAIIGPNGSGKSNLMDAISFVLGERATSLRVKKLGDLIHGAPVGKPVATRCFVALNYKEDDGRMRCFHRGVVNNTNEFKVDGKVVTASQYNSEMESINIFIKAKNFLVYQGAIESIAMKNPKERTTLFEELSRSCELQTEYDRLKVEMQKAEDDAQQNMNKRRGIAQEKREARQEQDEAEKYRNMKEELNTKQKQQYLFELFHCERYAKEAKQELVEKQDEVERLSAAKNETDELVSTKHKALKKVQRDVHKFEKDIADKEREIAAQRPVYLQAKQEAIHVNSKLDTAKKTLSTAQKMAEKQDEQLKTLEKQAKDLEREKSEYEQEMESQSQELELNLSEDQLREYMDLKGEAAKRSGMMDMQLNSLRGEHESDKTSLQYEQRREANWQEKIKSKEQELQRYKKQIEHLGDAAEQQKTLLSDEKQNLVVIERQVKESKEKLETVTVELNDVSRQLADASGDTAENDRNRRRNEAIDNLRRVFPDKVFGRLVDLCQPSHKRFQLAVTKVLQKHMMSIVCDNDETAREAIVYLKEQRYPPETFLPSNALDVHPINEKIRELQHPKGVKLVYDVIQCNNSSARKALQFSCGNAVICESAEDARYLAYGSGGTGERYKAVALDGTMFQQSGVIAGGSAELKQRAKKWDENAIRKLREKRSQLQEECNTLHKNRRKELDVEMQKNKLTQLEVRMRQTVRDKQRIENETLSKLGIELETLQSELGIIPPKMEEIKQRLEHREKELQKLEKKSNAVADEVFAGFCANIGIRNIREYEDRELRMHEERTARLRDFDNQLDRVRNELEYLRSENKDRKAKTETEKVKRLEKDLESLRKKEGKEEKTLGKLENEHEELKMSCMEKRNSLESHETELAQAKKEAQGAQRDVTNAEKSVLALEANLSRRQNERHTLLHAAKINQVQIALTAGSLADVDAQDDDEGDGSQPTTSTIPREQIEREAKIKVNYRGLPDELKDIEDEHTIRKQVERMTKEISDMQNSLSRFNAPNLRANQRMEEVKEREAETTEEFEVARKKARRVRTQFEKVKTERYRKFQECFEPVSQKIDEIYKSLSRNASAQAFLGADNMEEPYLEGIQYNCVAPGKRFRPMDNLSGGEKTVAALALLFAVHARNPSPFFVLDEIDAALDNTNIGKVASFICESARENMQIIVISLKEEFYNKADCLVGIYPQPANCTVSGVATFDLTAFKQLGLNDSVNDTSVNM